jgi:hypothetical protein
MRLVVLAGVCMLVGVGVSSAWAQPASIDLVTSAVAALGGEQAIRGLTISIDFASTLRWQHCRR